MSSAGQTTVTTIGTAIFDAGHPLDRASAFAVGVSSVSSFGALVNVSGLHNSNDYYPIEPGDRIEFRKGHMGISHVTAKGDGGDAVVAFGLFREPCQE